jgi:hypothetical protein
MRARSTWSLALVVATLGCNGAIGGSNNPGVTGSGTGTAGSTGTGTGTGTGGSGISGTGTGVGGATGTGTGIGGSTGAGGSGVVTLPGSALQSQPTWRLTTAEYSNSLRDLLGMPASVQLDPDSSSDGGYWVGGQASDNSVRAYHSAAIELATAGVSPANLLRLVPCSATPTAACASTFIASFAPKAFRRPLDPAQSTALNQVFATISGKYGFALGIQAVLEAILQSPYFLYHLEIEEQAKALGKVAVTNYSMASRLSYLLWSTTPDDVLLGKAAAGTLVTAAQVQAEATRMIADPRAVTGLRNFYEQWMHLADLPPSKTPPFATIFTPALAASIRTSFDMQMDAALWADKGAVTALLTSREAYVDGNLAPIMGVTGVTGNTMQKVQLNPAQRAGILTHPALMSIFATQNQSHPIKRGVFLWDKVLCKPLPDPPADVPPFTAPGPGVSLRQRFEMLTAVGSCPACHVRINPVGFLFENYDTVGQYRTIDDFNQPVNTSVTIVGTGDPTLDVATTSATQFLDRLGTDDASVATCMVKQIYRYAAKRREASSGADDADITTLNTAFTSSGQSVKQVLSALTQTEIFLNRLNVQ